MTREPETTNAPADPPVPEDVAIRCPHCGIEFATDGLLEDHLQRVHRESGP